MNHLSHAEESKFVRCEAVIEQGLKTFVEVGTALMEIRDGRLYRAQYRTFESYCRERWGLERRRAYQLIDAAAVVENVKNFSQPPAVESHAAALATVEPEQQSNVWERAVETAPDGRVTAAHVKQVAKEFRPPERYMEVWELEGGVRSWLDLQDAPEYEPAYFLEEAQKKGRAFEALLSHLDSFRRPRRKGDVLQAVNNVLDQLRQQQRRQEPAPEQDVAPPPDRLAVHYSSERSDWETPQWLFNILDEEFHFDVDVCATADNAKVPWSFFSPEQDGLAQEWRGVCWMNPPYSRKEMKGWVKKAYMAARINGATVVCLLPARTDTSWWWDYCIGGEIRFLRGRLKFGGADNGAPFPSAVVIFGPGVKPAVVWWEEGSSNDV